MSYSAVGPFSGRVVAAVQTELEGEASRFASLGRPVHAPKVLRALLKAWMQPGASLVSSAEGTVDPARIGPPITTSKADGTGRSESAGPSVKGAASVALSSSDEVYVVHVDGRTDPVHVFGHREDAEAFAQAIWGEFREALDYAVIATPVCDHADARRLIEQEEG